MTAKSDKEQAETIASRRDDDEQSTARKDPEATTEDQAANMDFEGDVPR
ncbi:hypothetical protein [Nocardia sp. NPDC056000]